MKIDKTFNYSLDSTNQHSYLSSKICNLLNFHSDILNKKDYIIKIFLVSVQNFVRN